MEKTIRYSLWGESNSNTIKQGRKGMVFMTRGHYNLIFSDEKIRTLPAIGGVAAVPSREKSLRKMIESAIPYLSQLHVYLNEWTSVPGWMNNYKQEDVHFHTSQNALGDITDRGKFFGAAKTKECIYFTMDDDLVYPPQYFTIMTTGLTKYRCLAAVGLHGCRVRPGMNSYYRDRFMKIHCAHKFGLDISVHILGSGVTGFHLNDNLRPHLVREVLSSNFNCIADLLLSAFFERREIKKIALAHDNDLIRYSDYVNHTGDSIWAKFTKDTGADKKQTQFCNLIEWARLPKVQLSDKMKTGK